MREDLRDRAAELADAIADLWLRWTEPTVDLEVEAHRLLDRAYVLLNEVATLTTYE